MTLQPYQKASKAIQGQNASPGKFLQEAASTAIGIGAAGSILKRIAPFFNKFIPQDIAIKGLSKINPTLGKFIQSSVSQGHPMNDVMDFVKQKLGVPEEEDEESKAALQAEAMNPEGSQPQRPPSAELQAAIQPQQSQTIRQMMAATPPQGQQPMQPQGRQLFQGPGVQQQTQGNAQAKNQLLQAMQALSQQLRS